MTTPTPTPPKPGTSLSLWPIVAMFAIGLAAIVSLLIFAPDSPNVSTVIGLVASILTPLIAAVYVTTHVGQQIGEVKLQVNGRMSQLIDKIPPPAPTPEEKTE